jgi:hypothetical protein
MAAERIHADGAVAVGAQDERASGAQPREHARRGMPEAVRGSDRDEGHARRDVREEISEAGAVAAVMRDLEECRRALSPPRAAASPSQRRCPRSGARIASPPRHASTIDVGVGARR